MRSKFFKDFGIPDAECTIEPKLDGTRVPRLYFTSKGSPVGLDLTGASQMRQLMEHAGDKAHAKEIDDYITKAQRLR